MIPVTPLLDAVETLEKERAELYSVLQQRRQHIQYLNAMLRKEQDKYDNLLHLMGSIRAFDTCMEKHLKARFSGSRANGTEYTWETEINPLPYFQSTLDIWDPDKVDGVSYLASIDVAGRIFNIFVEEHEGSSKYQVRLVPQEVRLTPSQPSSTDTWEHTIFGYVGKRLPQEVSKSFHCIDDVIAWLRAIKHPEIRISQESYLGLPCVDTFSGLRITCDGRVHTASE